MEKGNKTNSAFENTSTLFYRQNGRIALRTFLENLRENGDANAETKQITQCVFLGALCLKPVPDIFHVALQPYTFKTRTRSVLCNNAEGLKRTDRPSRKQPRKNTRKAAGAAPTNANSSRLLELFGNTHISDTLSKLGLNATSKQPGKSTVEHVIPVEKHVRKPRKMDVKTNKLPLLVPVKEIIDLETKNGDLQTLEPILIELDEDDIEDYLEVDQNVVADLEALIPDEEIEFISNSLIKPKQIIVNDTKPPVEIPVIKHDDIEGIPEIKVDNEEKVNETLETIAINEEEVVKSKEEVEKSKEEVVKSNSRKIAEFPCEIEKDVVLDKEKDLTIEIPVEKKDYETRTLRSGVKVSPPYSQSAKSKRSQIPKLIPVKNKEVKENNTVIDEVQNEEIISNKEDAVIVEEAPKNEEIGEKLPIPTIVLDDPVKEEEPVEIPVEKEVPVVAETIEDKSNENLNVFEKMMKNQRKIIPKIKTKKQRKARLSPKKRVKAKVTRKIVQTDEESRNVEVQVPEESTVKDEDKVEEIINEDEVEEIISADKEKESVNEEVKEDKVEVINEDEDEDEIIDVEKIDEINLQDNNNTEIIEVKRKNKRKNAIKTPTNGERKTKTKNKKRQRKSKTIENSDSKEISVEPKSPEITNNNDKEMKRINDEENATSRKKRKTKDEMDVSSPESSELSLENKDPDITNSDEAQIEAEDQLEYPSKEPYRRIYRCRVCLLVFETYNKLKSHKMVHDVKNPYQCQECGKSYDDVEELAAHLRIHKGKMPYPCKKCDASFWTAVQLERHQLVHVLKKVPPPNNAAPKRIFKCEECGKEFKKICDLERHTRVHTGEKPSVCNICNKRFQQAYNLNKHLLIHTQEKNFECIICQKKFGRNDVLNRHVLTHSIDKPFHCSICSKTFIRNTQLNLHIRKHHGSKTDPKNGKKPVESGPGKSSD